MVRVVSLFYERRNYPAVNRTNSETGGKEEMGMLIVRSIPKISDEIILHFVVKFAFFIFDWIEYFKCLSLKSEAGKY